MSPRYEIVETIDGSWMVLVNGFQWGPDASRYDKSGANDATFETAEVAMESYLNAKRGESCERS